MGETRKTTPVLMKWFKNMFWKVPSVMENTFAAQKALMQKANREFWNLILNTAVHTVDIWEIDRVFGRYSFTNKMITKFM